MDEIHSDYHNAYQMAKRDLASLVEEQQRLERRKLALRKTIETLGDLCESENIAIEPSPEAAEALEASLADEIRVLLRTAYPGSYKPHNLMEQLKRLGRDLSAYSNPQATIQMVLKRMQDGDEVEEIIMPDDGKKAYRLLRGMPRIMKQSARRRAQEGIG